MATNLYEILGINRNATTEEVRRAYRRKALETHPDRLPQGASAAEKSASEDLFRKVNNAYEVLQDPGTRASYDQHGVWPPPEPTPQSGPRPFSNGSAHHDPFSSNPFFRTPFPDPFFRAGPRTDPFGGFGFGPRAPPPPRPFTDPFVLFNSIFGDFHRAFEADPFFDDPFGRRGGHPGAAAAGGGFFLSPLPPMMPSPFGMMGGGGSSSRIQTFGGGGNGGGWVSQSWSSSTVNGVTHTKSVRRDSQGNEHVTYRYPDGTERYTINGIEQSSTQPQRALPAAALPAPPAVNRTHDSILPPPYHEAVAQLPHRSHSSRHYHDHPDDRRGDRGKHSHDRDKGREYEYERGGHGHRDGRYGQDAQNGSAWNVWRP